MKSVNIHYILIAKWEPSLFVCFDKFLIEYGAEYWILISALECYIQGWYILVLNSKLNEYYHVAIRDLLLYENWVSEPWLPFFIYVKFKTTWNYFQPNLDELDEILNSCKNSEKKTEMLESEIVEQKKLLEIKNKEIVNLQG